MTGKEFDTCLHNLCVTASNGGQMSNSQLIGSLEIAKLNIHRMLATEAERKQSSNILKVAPLVSPGISG